VSRSTRRFGIAAAATGRLTPRPCARLSEESQVQDEGGAHVIFCRHVTQFSRTEPRRSRSCSTVRVSSNRTGFGRPLLSKGAAPSPVRNRVRAIAGQRL